MNEINEIFAPSNENEKIEFAVEALALSIQLALQRAMNSQCVTQKELADRLGVSPARVSQILASQGANLTLKTIGKVAHALGEEFELVTKSEAKRLLESNREGEYRKLEKIARAPRRGSWQDKTANENRFPDLLAA